VLAGNLNVLAAREHRRELVRAAGRRRMSDPGATPVTRVTLRYASAADMRALRRLAALSSARAPSPAMLVAEVDGRLRAALALDGSRSIADPHHQGAEFVELLRVRAAQLTRG
jgi:hypothetical protein